MGINLADTYETLTSSYSPAIGEELIEFEIKISDKDYKTIIKKIESIDNFQIVARDNSPDRSYSGPNSDFEIIGWKKENTYFYEIYKNNKSGFENYILSLNPDKILKVQYMDE